MIKGSKDSELSLVFYETFSEILWPSSWVVSYDGCEHAGQVT